MANNKERIEENKKKKEIMLISHNTYLIDELKNSFLKIKEYEKNEFLSSKVNSLLNRDEKIIYCISPKKNKKIIAEVKYDINKKRYTINLNYFQELKNNNNYTFHLCEKCDEFYDKDEILYHSITQKHNNLKVYQIKCDLHNKNIIYLNYIENTLYCEDCVINTNNNIIPLISKFNSKIIYSNKEIFYGNLIKEKKEGIGIYYYNDSSIFIGNFINDFPQLPGIYKDIKGNSKDISEKWGDFQEYLFLQNFLQNNVINDLFEINSKIREKNKSIFYDIEIEREYNIYKDPKYYIKLIKNSFYSDLTDDDFFIYFLLKLFKLNTYIDLRIFPYLKKGFQIYFGNYQFFEIQNNLEKNFDIKTKITDNNKEKIIFYFSELIDIENIIEIRKKIVIFNKDNNNCLFNYLIFFIFNEKELSNQIRINSGVFNSEIKLNISYIFLECNNLKNIFENTKYKSKNYFMILNKENIVLKIGMNNSFEKKFLDLLNKSNHNNSNFFDIKNNLIDFINKSNLKMKVSYNTNFHIIIPYKFKMETNDELILISNPKIHFFGGSREKEYNYYKKKLLNILPEKNIHLTKLETINIDIDNLKEICFNCKKNLNPQKEIYYCFWCKIAFCEECVENKLYKSKNEGFNKLIHKEHNLLYFKTRKKETFFEIDKHKLGNNIFYKIPEIKWKKTHDMICNGCLKDELESRFLCLNCRPGEITRGGYVDYCYDCIQHLKKNDEEGKRIENEEDKEMKKLDNSNIKITHNHKQHIYLNIVVNATNDYYLF